MADKKIKVKYIGLYTTNLITQTFRGKIKPGDIIEFDEKVFNDDLKTHVDWTLVVESESPKKSKKEKEKANGN